MRLSGWVWGLAFFFSACTSAPPASDAGSDGASDLDAGVVDAFVARRDAGPHFDLGTTARPAPVVLPMAYDGTTRLPLIILLHADGVTGLVTSTYLHVGEAARAGGAYVAMPTGTADSHGFLVWNDGITTTNAVDDVAYLSSVLDHALAMLPVDTSRVYFVGHANGGFMAYRMACEESARVAGIAAVSGGDFPTPSPCTPSRPVSVLDVHGTLDAVASFDGVFGVYAGSVEATQRWAQIASCNLSTAHMPAPFDMDGTVAGNETTATDYIDGCTGARVSLYSMAGSGHIPAFSVAAGQDIVDWLLARSAAP